MTDEASLRAALQKEHDDSMARSGAIADALAKAIIERDELRAKIGGHKINTEEIVRLTEFVMANRDSGGHPGDKSVDVAMRWIERLRHRRIDIELRIATQAMIDHCVRECADPVLWTHVGKVIAALREGAR